VRQDGQRLGRGLAHERADGAQRGQQLLGEAVVLTKTHRPGQHGENVYFLGLFERLTDGDLRVLGGTLDEQQGGLALSSGVTAVAQRFLQAGGVRLGRPDGVGGGQQQAQADQNG